MTNNKFISPIHYCFKCGRRTIHLVVPGMPPKIPMSFVVRCPECDQRWTIPLLKGFDETNGPRAIFDKAEEMPHRIVCNCSFCHWISTPTATAMMASLMNLNDKGKIDHTPRLTTRIVVKTPANVPDVPKVKDNEPELPLKSDTDDPCRCKKEIDIYPQKKPFVMVDNVAMIKRMHLPIKHDLGWDNIKNEGYKLFQEWAKEKTNKPNMPCNAYNMAGFADNWSQVHEATAIRNDDLIIHGILKNTLYGIETVIERLTSIALRPMGEERNNPQHYGFTKNVNIWRIILEHVWDLKINKEIVLQNRLWISRKDMFISSDFAGDRTFGINSRVVATVAKEWFIINSINSDNPSHVTSAYTAYKA